MPAEHKSFDQRIAEIDADPQRRNAANFDIFKHELIQALMKAFEIERADKALSKADLAKATNLNPVTVRRILTDPSANPRLSTLVDLADSLDCQLVLVPKANRNKRHP